MKTNILVADDDPDICEALSIMLGDAGYTVKTTLDGKIVKLIRNEMPDILLLDVWMSGQDGLKICTFLKKQNQTKNIPIIMVSATRDLENSARRAGADDFLTKPFDMTNLLTKIEKYI